MLSYYFLAKDFTNFFFLGSNSGDGPGSGFGLALVTGGFGTGHAGGRSSPSGQPAGGEPVISSLAVSSSTLYTLPAVYKLLYLPLRLTATSWYISNRFMVYSLMIVSTATE
jgi:hypothetical protein